MPRSIVGRTAWVLTIGFVIVISGSVLVSSAIIRSESHEGNLIEVATKIIMMTSILKNMSTDNRISVIDNFQDKNIKILHDDRILPEAGIIDDWGTRKVQRHLQSHMASLGLQDIRVTHPKRIDSDGLPDKSQIIISVIFQDGKEIQFVANSPHRHFQMIMYILLITTFIIAGIYILSMVVTRQIIKPLKQFSKASTRFSMDLFAPALDETGPVEIKGAAIAFNTMQDRIRRFVNERMQMIAAISHDLRTPLTRLRLRAESIDNNILQKKSLRDIAEMQSMLDSTLSFARDDASTEARTIVDLATLIKSICDDESDSGNKAQYNGPEHLNYNCKPIAMRRVINNIIGNAIKYAGEVCVSLTSQSNNILIEVSDNGTGIPDDQFENVFTPFYRIEASRNRETGGSGLGLTVAKTIVRAHGGDISIKNSSKDLAKGLTVNISLPLF
ncbi:MAG: HAMP domain-containing protein [Gammaproteobacteria bacterium]|nr:HAMP domain-containing protein [Gammaproteobacteria bacterium]